jgi:hypothetical protein
VRALHIRQGRNQTEYLFFHSIRQRLFHQIANAIAQEFNGYLDNKQTHDDGCYWIKHSPPMTKEDGATNADGRSYG